MKKNILGFLSLFLLIPFLSGCVTESQKSADLSVIYTVAAMLSLVLLFSYCLLANKKSKWFVFLFSSVLVVNVGYAILSVSESLEMALWANRISYLGSVFLPLSMMMIILNATNTRYKPIFIFSLFALSTVVFLIAASPGILDVYYKEVSFEIINGVGKLIKVYGPLHPLYFIYLLGYFSSMVAVIIRAQVKKTINSTSHAVVLAISVFVNIGVWLIEQLVSIDFEFLSISYIISELFLLGVHLVMQENQRLNELIKERSEEKAEESTLPLTSTSASSLTSPLTSTSVTPAAHSKAGTFTASEEAKEIFKAGLEKLTPTEREIYESYLLGKTTKEIMSEHNIKENTLKFHNKNLYGKLGVSSRKQLLETYKAIKETESLNQ